MSILLAILRFFTRTSLFVYCCYWLIVLLVLGTLAQREIGLYAAQKIYFSSWLLPVAGVPLLPGGRLTMLVVFVGLIAFFVQRFSLHWTRVGSTVLHFGAIMLLVGGFLTAYFSTEGSVVIPEGESSSFVSDYHARELVLLDTSDSEFDQVTAFGDALFDPGAVLAHESIPASLEVIDVLTNCEPVRRDGPAPEDAQGFYRNFDLEGRSEEQDGERNILGLILRVSGAGDATDGLYAVMEHQSVPQTLAFPDGRRTISLRRQRTYLPFELELLDFQKILHPGTGMARSYRSIVNLIEDGTTRRVVIQMNEPLRHGGFTFYQSSFIEGMGSETTVLSAVRNAGRLLPYISSLVMCFGLLILLVVKVPTLIRSRGGAA